MHKKYILSPKLDFILIQFPIWIPLIYLLTTSFFPSIYMYILISYLLIGEIHFGSTFIFFLDKKYRELFLTEKYIFIFWPLLLIFFCIFFSIFFSVSAVLFLILLFNFYHVNRQSVGVLKLYSNRELSSINNLSTILLYILSFGLCIAGIFKYIFKSKVYFVYEFEIISIFITLYLISMILLIFLLKKKKEDSFSLLTNFTTGVLIFSPILFCKNIIDVFAMGVGMHYMQYIAITWSIFKRKSEDKLMKNNDQIFFKYANIKIIIIYLFIYGSLMVFFSNLNIEYKSEQIGIYLIPIFFQLMHFYIDMFIWRFSNHHTKENLNPYIFSKATN